MSESLPTGVELPTSALLRLCTLSAFASSIGMRVSDPMLPALSAEFGVAMSDVAPVVSLFAVAYGGMQIFYGPFGQRYGPFRVAAWATLMTGLASVICLLAPGLQALMFGRLLTGAAAAGIIPTLFAWLGERVPYEDRQVTIAKVVSGVTLGAVCGQSLGGVLVDTVGWRWAFVPQSLLLTACGLLMLHHSYRIRPRGQAEPDRTLSEFGIAALVRDYRGLLQLAWVKRVLATVGVEGLVIYGTVALLPAFMHQRFGIPIWQASLASALFGLGGFLYTRLARRLLNALGEARLVRVGWLVGSLSLIGLLLAPHWRLAALASLLFGIGFYCQHNTLQAHGTQMAPEQRGLAMSAFATVYFAGQATGVFLSTTLAQIVGFDILFGVLAVALALLGASFERALGNRHGGSHALGR